MPLTTDHPYSALSAQFFALPVDECTLRDATKALQHNVSAFPDFLENLDQLVSTYGRPHYIVAHWMNYTLYAFAAYSTWPRMYIDGALTPTLSGSSLYLAESLRHHRHIPEFATGDAQLCR